MPSELAGHKPQTDLSRRHFLTSTSALAQRPCKCRTTENEASDDASRFCLQSRRTITRIWLPLSSGLTSSTFMRWQWKINSAQRTFYYTFGNVGGSARESAVMLWPLLLTSVGYGWHQEGLVPDPNAEPFLEVIEDCTAWEAVELAWLGPRWIHEGQQAKNYEHELVLAHYKIFTSAPPPSSCPPRFLQPLQIATSTLVARAVC
eukprot:5894751-Amphidinium_carterae.2